MSSFHLTLPSNGVSQKEFPNNTNNSWKVRLPQPITLEGEWKVGLSSISYPADSILTQYLNSLSDSSVLLRTKRVLKSKSGILSSKKQTVKYSDIKSSAILSVKDLLTRIFDAEWLLFITSLNANDNPSLELSDGTLANYQWKVKIEQDSITLDTSVLHRKKWSDIAGIEIDFSENLLRKFGFLVDEIDGNNKTKTNLKPGPNLKVKFRSDADGWSSSSRSGWPYGMENCWGVDDCIRLRIDLQWTFLNLRHQSHEKGTEARSLYVYSSLCAPQMMGSDTVDLLRQVVNHPSLDGGSLYEPHNIQYVDVRQKVFNIVETEIGEVDENSLARFHKGNTTLTVHFRKVE